MIHLRSNYLKAVIKKKLKKNYTTLDIKHKNSNFIIKLHKKQKLNFNGNYQFYFHKTMENNFHFKI